MAPSVDWDGTCDRSQVDHMTPSLRGSMHEIHELLMFEYIYSI